MKNTIIILLITFFSLGFYGCFPSDELTKQLEEKNLLLAQKDRELAVFDSLLLISTNQTAEVLKFAKKEDTEHDDCRNANLICEKDRAAIYKKFAKTLRQNFTDFQYRYGKLDTLYTKVVEDYHSLADSNLVVWGKYVYLAQIIADIKTGKLSVSGIDSLNIQL